MNWDSVVGVADSTLVKADLLCFDTSNPRFTPDKRPEDGTNLAIVRKLASSADLAELVQSIATSGYINIEPLIVVASSDCLRVLEGNRRLAAIMCLRDPEFARSAGVSLPEFEKAKVLASTDMILVYRVEREEDARDLIGFKHINGPQSWDAYAKAKFATKWLDDEKQLSADGKESLSLNDIANRMGDKHATIFRMVTAYYVLDQAETEEVFSVDDRAKKAFSFSHLYTGLSYVEFTDYLGMPRPQRAEDPSTNPVPHSHIDNLKNLLHWLYGSQKEELQPLIKSQNPDLGLLREVLKSKAATRELEERVSLADALVTATPKDVRFSRHILAANNELLKALNTLDGFDPESQSELEEIVESAAKRAISIRSSVRAAIEDINGVVE
ncbi:hypothetical protein [Litoreibacter roseus]|nr:hypothetical protein [Litoreibacter roseus]